MPESVAWTSTVSEGISDEAAGDPLHPANPTANRTAAALRISAYPPNFFMCPPILLKPAAAGAPAIRAELLRPRCPRRTVRHGHGRVKGRMRVDKPPWTCVIEVRQRSLLERLCRVLVAGNRAASDSREPARPPHSRSGWFCQRSRRSTSRCASRASAYSRAGLRGQSTLLTRRSLHCVAQIGSLPGGRQRCELQWGSRRAAPGQSPTRRVASSVCIRKSAVVSLMGTPIARRPPSRP